MRKTRVGLVMVLVILALTAFASTALAGSDDFILLSPTSKSTRFR